jgi:hypothetical protein
MRGLQFEILEWLGASGLELRESETLASVRISVGSLVITEVDDDSAHTVRQHINVSAHTLARWLLVNWWRLRWEAGGRVPTEDWVESHHIASSGGGYVWPNATFASDGDVIQIRVLAEAQRDAAVVRYLRSVTFDVAAADFEAAVDELFEIVEARLRLRVPADREFSELLLELRQEREDPEQALICRLQARAGIDPGAASVEWLAAARALVAQAGAGAGEELIAALPGLPGGIRDAELVLSGMRQSSTTIDLAWATGENAAQKPGEIPWERGRRLAKQVRKSLGIGAGPVKSSLLQERLDTEFPLPSAWRGSRALLGGFRDGGPQERTAVLVTSARPESQRFYLARLIGAAVVASEYERVLAVSDAATALQKFERAFAQEFLCPWEDLSEFMRRSSFDEESIADAAEHFGVSDLLIESTLVNKGVWRRSRLDGR